MSRIRVGPAGWDYPDWQGIVFPKPRPRGFDPLEYLSRYFSTIEINTTFYGPGTPETADAWAQRVAGNDDFKFTAKLWRRFTHERGAAFTADDVRAARAPLDRLLERQRLGAVLLQFPWSYRYTDQNIEWLRDVEAAFRGLPLVLEVRHVSWNVPQAMETLAAWGMGLVNVDQPLFKDSIAPAARAIGGVGYVRLHGRNYREWWRASASGAERYDYLYTADELSPWIERIKAIAARPATREVYAVTNNHRFGKAPANAEMIEAILTGEKVQAPPGLLARYPDALGPFAEPDPGPLLR
jgi:uncharacterized protein YecE (DUF72 family)